MVIKKKGQLLSWPQVINVHYEKKNNQSVLIFLTKHFLTLLPKTTLKTT